jgi:hypothetical protein
MGGNGFDGYDDDVAAEYTQSDPVYGIFAQSAASAGAPHSAAIFQSVSKASLLSLSKDISSHKPDENTINLC